MHNPGSGRRFALHFSQIDETSRNRVGGKGYHLSRLYRAGFPVPTGFVTTVDAYWAFLAANNLEPLVADVLADDNLPAASLRVITAFEGAEVPASIAAAVCQAYLALGSSGVAVRSSAGAEDCEVSSFAGQHDTVLGVADTNTLLEAVRQCWASLWSQRALAYRRRLGAGYRTPAMAVVIQEMVDASQSGVAFTVDPVSGQRDVIVVEAIAGTGEALVSGQVTPDRYILQHEDEHPVAAGGVLNDYRLAAVASLARSVAAWAGQPQDVEWALDDAGQVYLLQARPITVVGGAASGAATRWTRDNVGEVLPDPVTPLSWSVLDRLGNSAFASVMRRLGVPEGRVSRLFGRFYARIYLNQTLFQSIVGRFYPSRVGSRALPNLALAGLRALSLVACLPAESESVIQAIRAQHRLEGELSLSAYSLADLLDRLAFWRRLETDAMKVHLAVTVVAELLYQALEKLLARWYRGPITAAVLTSGLTGIRSAETGQALASIARQVRQDERLRSLVVQAPARALPAELAKTEVGRALWARIEGFLAEYGHSAAQEFELAAPRWRDDPAIVFRALKAQVRAEVVVAGLPCSKEGQASDYATAIAHVGNQLGTLQGWLFRLLLHRVRAFASARENLKYHFVLAHSRLRALYLALAAQMVRAEQLESTDDVFFLTDQEVIALVEKKMTFEESRNWVKERRETWVAEQSISPPFALDQLPSGLLHPTPPAAQSGEQSRCLLRGVAASAGSYIGRARVMSPLDGDEELMPGEVLVARAITPGWAPMLLGAGALVTEIGGVLSHGAIIAREYGLPAVLNVVDATERIRTGQRIYVDGTQGTVRLLKENA